jgi:hypothetical protein
MSKNQFPLCRVVKDGRRSELEFGPSAGRTVIWLVVIVPITALIVLGYISPEDSASLLQGLKVLGAAGL